MRRHRSLNRSCLILFQTPKSILPGLLIPSRRWESQLGPISYLLPLCEYFMHCMASKKTPDTRVRPSNCFLDSNVVPWRTSSQNIWSKKIYLHLMWSSASQAASKLLGKCLCGRLASPGPLIIQVRDLLAVQNSSFPACTPQFPFHKRNCSLFSKEYITKFKLFPGKIWAKCLFTSY